MAAVATERMTHMAVHQRDDSTLEEAQRQHRAHLHSSNTSAVHSTTERGSRDLPRSASYTFLPDPKDPRYGARAVVAIKRMSKDDFVAQSDDDDTVELSLTEESPVESSGWNTPELDHAQHISPPQAQDIAAQLQQIPVRTSSHSFQLESAPVSVSTSQPSVRDSTASVASTAATSPSTSKRPSRSFSRRFSGRSWYPSTPSIPSSRSPSPTKQDSVVEPIAEEAEKPDVASKPASSRKSFISRKRTIKPGKENETKGQKYADHTSGDDEQETPVTSLHRKSTFLRKKATRAAGLSTISTSDGGTREVLLPSLGSVPAVPPLPKSFSTERLPSARSHSSQSERRAAMPKQTTSEKHHISPLSASKKKDELWTQFRTLDADYSKFSSKSTALKANVVRNSLIPFLRTFACHPSNKTLRPEDLDRRTSILNKWWMGLIEMLHGRNNQSISGTDRPVILDGISGIMERPEWRVSPSPFCPLAERVTISPGTGSRSTTSLGSSSSDFLADSVNHNVRNTFVSNLTSQMAFVVDKMSLRHASASLVTFCGKACAYAFMFVPGMADVLVRLWDVSTDLFRRVLQENGHGKFDRIPDATCTRLISSFPPALHNLGFTSLTKYMRKMRIPPPLPVGTQHIQWWGHWVERWSGRESDLFYVFVKHYHILATDFLPPPWASRENICIPGMLPVHAQILANLELTIHRDANQAQHDATSGPSNPTFDDVLADPDAVASTLPIPPTNAVRLMAENRLIMLIRDFLSERTADHPVARDLFAHSFNGLLQAAARGTSMFDHSACYTLLDYLEEALVILVRYEALRANQEPLIDSDFWKTVCKKMIESENTMTEIRLYAFLFTVWNAVVGTDARKTALCGNLLLDEDVFESRFNHWCPMVRAYYMRLLCWRVARYDEEGSEPDIVTLELLHRRLLHTWSHYLHLCEKAENENSWYPETSPCLPAPGRRLLIVRTDNVVNHGGSFLTFDGLMRDAPMQFPKRPAATAAGLVDSIEVRPESSSSNYDLDSDNESQNKGIGSFLRKIIGSSSKIRSKTKDSASSTKEKSTFASSRFPDASPPHSGITRSATDNTNSPSATPTTKAAPPAAAAAPAADLNPPHHSLSFKFSLEFHHPNKPSPQIRLSPPRLPLPAQNLLLSQGIIAPPHAAVNHLPQRPVGESVSRVRYAGRALAEWTVIIGECQSFFDRRLKEGVPGRKWVETPSLGVEVFKRPS